VCICTTIVLQLYLRYTSPCLEDSAQLDILNTPCLLADHVQVSAMREARQAAAAELEEAKARATAQQASTER
jgi:hypothetical protein